MSNYWVLWPIFIALCMGVVRGQCDLDTLEPNNQRSIATRVEVGSAYSDLTICTFKDTHDVYSYIHTGGGTSLIKFALAYDQSTGNIDATATNSDSTFVSSISAVNNRREIGVVAGGVFGNQFYVDVSRGLVNTASTQTTYSLSISQYPCFEDEYEPNNVFPGQWVTTGKLLSGLTLCGFEDDYYQMVYLTPQMVSVKVNGQGSLIPLVAFLDVNGNPVMFNNDTTTQNKRLDYWFPATPSQTLVLRVWPSTFQNGVGVYSMEVSFLNGFGDVTTSPANSITTSPGSPTSTPTTSTPMTSNPTTSTPITSTSQSPPSTSTTSSQSPPSTSSTSDAGTTSSTTSAPITSSQVETSTPTVVPTTPTITTDPTQPTKSTVPTTPTDPTTSTISTPTSTSGNLNSNPNQVEDSTRYIISSCSSAPVTGSDPNPRQSSAGNPGNNANSEDTSGNLLENSSSKSGAAVGAAAGAVGGTLILVLLAVAAIFIYRRRSHGKQNLAGTTIQPLPGNGPRPIFNSIPPTNYSAAAVIGPSAASLVSQEGILGISGTQYTELDKDIIPFRDLEIKRKIGEGSFGCVFKARWRSSPVAVKEISQKSSFDEQAIEAFKKEANMMRNLRPHPNVILFLGICVPPDPICIVVEYLKNGSLFEYLKNRENSLNITQKVRLLLGISQGMLHIQQEGIVHRDLAARNILLGSNLEPKVSDFGMSRTVSAPEQVGKTYNNVGPLKWMAPESILENIYSSKSDVWSFGVVCYEVVSRLEPYYELNAVQAAYKVIHQGLRLELPDSENPPLDLQILVASCFQTDPALRPSFDRICSDLDRIDKFLKPRRDLMSRSSITSSTSNASDRNMSTPSSNATSHIAYGRSGGDSGGSMYNKTPNTPNGRKRFVMPQPIISPTIEEMMENENYQLTPSKNGSAENGDEVQEQVEEMREQDEVDVTSGISSTN